MKFLLKTSFCYLRYYGKKSDHRELAISPNRYRGFIRKLPTHLVESFKSTLDEVREADILVHMVDISHPAFEEQIEVVERTLHEIDETENQPSSSSTRLMHLHMWRKTRTI